MAPTLLVTCWRHFGWNHWSAKSVKNCSWSHLQPLLTSCTCIIIHNIFIYFPPSYSLPCRELLSLQCQVSARGESTPHISALVQCTQRTPRPRSTLNSRAVWDVSFSTECTIYSKYKTTLGVYRDVVEETLIPWLLLITVFVCVCVCCLLYTSDAATRSTV